MASLTRDETVRRIERLCDHELPRHAAERLGEYPIRWDHCFRRVAYDFAVGDEWTEEVDRPFIENAPYAYLWRAYVVAATMCIRGPETVHNLNDRSLEYRSE